MSNRRINLANLDAVLTKLTKNTYPPEILLWSSVLELAVNDYVHGYIHGYGSDEFRRAREWIYSTDQSAFNSFDAICMVFNLEPDAVRKELASNPIGIKERLSGKKVTNG